MFLLMLKQVLLKFADAMPSDLTNITFFVSHYKMNPTEHLVMRRQVGEL